MIDRESAVLTALENIHAGAALEAWAFVATAAGDVAPVEGPLRGVPFGVKDIIDVARMPTSYGLRPELRRARFDAWCVAVLRGAGAVPVGKTQTTAHAYRDPAATMNPLDIARTPGGSSAGSAAAVAAGHVPFALGTQTIGSILRPAAYCGVVGFKPTWGRIPMNGVAPFAPSLDHIGVIARNTGTVHTVARILMPSPVSPLGRTPRLVVSASLLDAIAAPEMRAVSAALDRLARAGLNVVRITLPPSVSEAPAAADRIVAYEAYATLSPLLGFPLPPALAQVLERGRTISRAEYASALAVRAAAFGAVDAAVAGFDAAIVPSAGAAPTRETTGDGSAFAAWSYFGMPAIALPIPGTAPSALSLQLVGAAGSDPVLLEAASVVEAALA